MVSLGPSGSSLTDYRDYSADSVVAVVCKNKEIPWRGEPFKL